MEEHSRYDGEVTLHYDDDDHKYLITDPSQDLEKEEVPSVTTATNVISKGGALLYWLQNKVQEEINENLKLGHEYDEIEREQFAKFIKNCRWRSSGEAMSTGSLVHKKAEDHALNQIKYGRCKVLDRGDDRDPDVPYIRMPYNEAAYNSLKQYLIWTRDHDVNFLAAERRCVHRDMLVGGTLDLFIEKDGKLTVQDHKTSSGIYFSHKVQVSAYAKFMEHEIEDLEVDEAAISRFPKDGEGFEIETLDRDQINHYFNVFRAAKVIYDAKQKE